MIDLASFYTTQTTPDASTQANGKATNGKNNGQATGLGIFDLLLQQLEQNIANGDKGLHENLSENGEHALSNENSQNVLNDETRLSLLRALAGNDTVAEDVEHLDKIAELDLLAEIEHTLALNQQIFDNKIRAETGNDDLLVDKETGEIIAPLISKALNLLEKLDTSELSANVDLNLSNLTPAQLALLQDIQEGIVPTELQAKDVVSILNTLQSGTVALAATANANLGKADIAAGTASRSQQGNPLPFNSSDVDAEGEMNFEQILKEAQTKKPVGGLKASNDLGSSTANTNQQAPTQAAFNVLQAWPFANSGSLYGSSTFSDQVAEQLGLSLNGSNGASQSGLSALVNQAQSASQSHPATQMVAASLTKSGKAGVDTNISLRLDPPGLGRVEIEMTFSKTKTLKAVVTAEKPETFMMLQRDAQVLERALQDAGLETDSGLSFELAQDGEFFDRHNQRGGGHEQGGTGRGGDASGDDVEIIESTMTWHVDSETGHTRYNIFV